MVTSITVENANKLCHAPDATMLALAGVTNNGQLAGHSNDCKDVAGCTSVIIIAMLADNAIVPQQTPKLLCTNPLSIYKPRQY